MLEHLIFAGMSCPSCFRGAGHLVATFSFTIILFGWRGHQVLAVVSARLARAGVHGPQTIGELYSTLPTWRIPESVEGFGFYLFMMLAGPGLAHYVKQLEKVLR